MNKRNSDIWIRIVFISIIVLLFVLITYCIYKEHNSYEIKKDDTVKQADDLVINIPDEEAYGTVTIYDPYGKLFSCVGNITISTDKSDESQLEIVVYLPK